MRSLSQSNKRSLKRSLGNIKGVPHTTISLKPKCLEGKDSPGNFSLHSTHSRSNSLSLSEASLKVVSIGTLCQHQKRPKSKFLLR